MAHTLTAQEQSLAKIFSDDYVFTIPGYQRPYSWGTDQAQELLDDLLGALADAPSSLNDAAPYFLGSIVLIKSPAVADATVVDGQQRLTTLTLLLAAIRAAVESPELQKDITGCIYERGSLVKGTQARYRLSLRERDRGFFREHVQHEDGLEKLCCINTPLPDAQSRLKANAQVFLDRLTALGQESLTRLVQFIITRCFLVTVATPDLDSAYRIFGVLNSRGLDLSATDILKAELIGGVSEKLRDTYTQKWENKEEDLGREAFGDLFSHIRMVYRKSKPKGTLLKEFKEHVEPSRRPQAFIDEVLLPMADAFDELDEANYASQRHAEHVNEHLRWLNRLEFKDWVPPALVFFVRFRNQPEAMLDFFRDLERLAFSMLIRKSGVNERIERFSALTAAIEKHADLFSEDSPLQLSAEEQYATYEVLSGPLYATHSSRALAVILLRLDRLLSDASATYAHEVVTVEHVLPQQPAPRSEWQTWVPDVQDHQQWVHRIGNLTLLSRKKNSAASNYEFDRKKAAYFTKGGISSFALTTQVLQHANWTVDVMRDRQEAMLRKLESHWRLENRRARQDLAQELLAKLAQLSGPTEFELTSSKHGLTAVARENGEEFVVLAGSRAKLDWTGLPGTYQSLRESLTSSGALTVSDDGKHLNFTRDVPFTSPSAASSVVFARSDNGQTSWRLKGTSINYAAWRANLPSPQDALEKAEG
ncbi:MAG: DUF4357 domain-containing protein [Bacteroides sp.]